MNSIIKNEIDVENIKKLTRALIDGKGDEAIWKSNWKYSSSVFYIGSGCS